MGRNWQWSFDKGRADRLAAELRHYHTGEPVGRPGLHSHDGTMQAKYQGGWASPTPVDIYQHIHQGEPARHHRGQPHASLARTASPSR
ncbi:hypothetical protein PVT67_11745 [Gallaecimonas kandeliae]|uniref:hypothetical protein n=1 Tax=Gallaecimonas kandeliae TaxID=3029055 RepID=UPI00264A377F|nr:hypothetical protein [Gallaecimonas kandeliae]WKE64353.1 hypothetical protein PVT67_11745 [Gallaecimonas kandeliae]